MCAFAWFTTLLICLFAFFAIPLTALVLLATTLFADALTLFLTFFSNPPGFTPFLPSLASCAFMLLNLSGFNNWYRPAFFQCIIKHPIKHVNVSPYITVVDIGEYFASTYIRISINITMPRIILIYPGILGAGIIRFWAAIAAYRAILNSIPIRIHMPNITADPYHRSPPFLLSAQAVL